jgi:hypothetical protein
LSLACTDVLRVLTPKDYDIYATRELEHFIQAREKRQENQPLCGEVGEMGGVKGKKRDLRDDELDKVATADTVIMQECGACGVAFCSLCQTTISLAEVQSTQWPVLHQRACPCVLLTRVLALNEATRLLLAETGAVKMTMKQTDAKQESQSPSK